MIATVIWVMYVLGRIPPDMAPTKDGDHIGPAFSFSKSDCEAGAKTVNQANDSYAFCVPWKFPTNERRK